MLFSSVTFWAGLRQPHKAKRIRDHDVCETVTATAQRARLREGVTARTLCYRRCPLRPSLHTFVFVSLTILAKKAVGAPPEVQRDNYGSQPQEWEFYGSTPDKHVKSWIKIVILAARERPLPIVFSTQQFELKGRPEQLIVIGDKEYSRLAAITRSQTCSRSAPKPKDMEWGISKVTGMTARALAAAYCISPLLATISSPLRPCQTYI